MEKTERWFLKRDVKNPDRLVYVSTKGEVSWDVPVDTLPTVEEKRHWDRHPKFVSLQRACDGWAWYTSNTGRLLPNYRDIEVEGEEERLPYLGNSDFHAWQQIPETNAPLPNEEDEAEVPFLPSQLRFQQSDSQLPWCSDRIYRGSVQEDSRGNTFTTSSSSFRSFSCTGYGTTI